MNPSSANPLFPVALLISTLALLFTVFSFWWMNWRKGKLHVGRPRSCAAVGATSGKMTVEVPLIFFNDGALPIVIQDLRLSFVKGQLGPLLRFVATSKTLGTFDERSFATQLAVNGREAIHKNCEFTREPGQLDFQVGTYDFKVEAQLDSKDSWEQLCVFTLNVEEKHLPAINKNYLVYNTS